MAEFDFLVSFLQGLWLAKMAICSILVDHVQIISVTVKRLVTSHIISSKSVQLLGLGPCGFPSFFFYFDVRYEVLFRVLLIMTSKNVVGFCRHRKNKQTFTVQILKILIAG